MKPINYYSIRTVSSGMVADRGNATLWTVNVNTGTAAAVLKIYDGESASGILVASIDASTKGSYGFGVLCRSGIFVDLSGAAADCTIGYALDF